MAQKLIIGPGRLSFPNLFKAQANDRGEMRYSLAILLPPETDLKPVKAALAAAATEKWGADKAKWPKQMRGPDEVIRKCEEKDSYAQFAGWHYINMSSSEQPGVIDAAKTPITDPREAYPGRWARVSAAAFAYDNKTRGVSIGLNNVQLLKHDEALGGKPRAEDEFDTYAEELGADDWT